MKILIIGGTGLISTAMTRGFVERGVDVTLFNRGMSEAPVPAGVQQFVGDRTDFAAFGARMAAAGPFDCVIDMICYKPEEAESLVRAFAGRTGHMIVCSTVDVYAKPASRYPIREDEPHAPPAWDYARNKEKCEIILQRAHDRGAVPITIIRPAFTYGEGRGMVHSFGGRTTHLDRVRKGKPIVVHGDGSSLWVSCHRDDVARAFVTAAGAAITFGKSYHVTGEEWMTWNQYHQKIAAAMDAPPPQLVHIPTDLLAAVAPRRANICAINFQYNNIFDNAAAHADLEFRYSIRFEEGVRRIVDWLDKRGRIEDSDQDPLDDRLIAAWERLGTRLREQFTESE